MTRDQSPARVPGGRRRVTRSGARRVNPVLLLSFAIPLLTVGALATVDPAPTQEAERAPDVAPLTHTVVVCPDSLPGATEVDVALADDATSGTLRIERGEGLVVEPGRVAVSERPRVVVMHGERESAVGLLAARLTSSGVATDCLPPSADTWFAGVGAGPEHSSQLLLVNPDQGPAVADVTVLTAGGVREVSRLRGLAVEPLGRTRLDLGRVMPEAQDVTLRVRVTRGRLASSVVDRVQEIGSQDVARAWLPGQAAPEVSSLLLGVRPGPGERTLVLANGGEDETLVRVAAVTEDSEFEPQGIDAVAVPGGTTVTVDLSSFLGSDNAEGLLGLRVSAGAPVSAVLRTREGTRMSYAVAAPPLEEPAAALVPQGEGRLVLSGADEVTDVVVQQRAGDGTWLPEETVTLRPGRTVDFAVDPQARWVQVVPDGVTVRAVVTRADAVATVRVLQELLTQRLVPHVRPALY